MSGTKYISYHFSIYIYILLSRLYDETVYGHPNSKLLMMHVLLIIDTCKIGSNMETKNPFIQL